MQLDVQIDPSRDFNDMTITYYILKTEWIMTTYSDRQNYINYKIKNTD